MGTPDPLLILVTNDDGINAPGIVSLRRALAPLGRVECVAPDREQSAASHALTLHHPLRMTALEPQVVSVEGTPTDCVLLAVHAVLDRRPDVLVSGINHGPNLGDDVNYSGTVAAAIEGHRLGIPSLAISLGREEGRDLEFAAQVTFRLVSRLFAEGRQGGGRGNTAERATAGDARPTAGDRRATAGDPARGLKENGFILNVNIPGRPRNEIHGFAITRLGKRVYRDVIVSKVDPHGRPYYWIGGETPIWEQGEGHERTDFAAVEAGLVSITPLRLDRTDYEGIEQLQGWDLAHLEGES